MAGAERVLLEMHKLYPEADIFTSVYDPAAMPAFSEATVKTSFLQKLPAALRYKHQLWAPLRPLAFKKLNLDDYDLVISSDSAEAKNVITRPDVVHISYNHTPIRYYWSHYQQYKADPGFGVFNPLVRLMLALLVRPLRSADYRAAQTVDYFIANSKTVKARINDYYNRDSTVINPPVDYSRFSAKTSKRSGYIIAGRQTPYKRFDLAIQACSQLGLPLTVIGDGTEHDKLTAMAGPTVTFKRTVDDAEMAQLFAGGAAFIFPAEEDFGITPVEAMAAGMPVIAYARGGASDWMIEGATGTLFQEQTVDSLVEALRNFKPSDYKPADLVAQAKKFSPDSFRKSLKAFVDAHASKQT